MLWQPVFAMPMPNFEAIHQSLVTELPPPPTKKRETTYDKICDCNFWKFWTIHKNKNTTVEFAIKTELETNFVWQDQSQNLT